MADQQIAGACACGEIQFRLTGAPIVTHACHCTQCQRETGSAFAVNLMIEADRLVVDAGAPERTGDDVAACPRCQTRLWAYHRMFGEKAVFVKAGVLSRGRAPDVHCFTSTKQPWLPLPEGVPAYAENYDFEAVLSAEARSRAQALFTG
jgi:hypothetical protein